MRENFGEKAEAEDCAEGTASADILSKPTCIKVSLFIASEYTVKSYNFWVKIFYQSNKKRIVIVLLNCIHFPSNQIVPVIREKEYLIWIDLNTVEQMSKDNQCRTFVQRNLKNLENLIIEIFE